MVSSPLILAALILGGWCIVLALEQGQLPRPTPLWLRAPSAIAVNLGLYLLTFSIEYLLFRRPIFALAMVISLSFFLLRVSNAKRAVLREPLLPSDFGLIKAVVRHPRLYLPFFGYTKALILLGLFVAMVALGLRMESAHHELVTILAIGLPVMLCGLALIWLGQRNLPTPSLVPDTDLHNLGLFTTLVQYAWLARQQLDYVALSPLRNAATPMSTLLPHVVMVQCESFFDARRLAPTIRPEVYQHFDTLCRNSQQFGPLQVAAWGANTLRTEFSILTGIANHQLGARRFNPYLGLHGTIPPTMTRHLKASGYHTVCVHPFSATFYDRDKLFPAFGFDTFIDIAGFDPQDKVGQYIGDRAVAQKISHLLQHANQPLFIFAITMENHGPLHTEPVVDADAAAFFTTPQSKIDHDLIAYLRHAQNTDAMLGDLQHTLQNLSQPAWLCAWGDHVPILSEAYAAANFTDARTDYVLYANTLATTDRPARQMESTPEGLMKALLQCASLQHATQVDAASPSS